MALLDLLGRRWALRVLWELRDEPATFRELQARCDGLSPSVLNQRLAELREFRIVESGEGGYQLTEAGRRLLAALTPLNEWANAWANAGGLSRPVQTTGAGRRSTQSVLAVRVR